MPSRSDEMAFGKYEMASRSDEMQFHIYNFSQIN